MLLLEIEGKSTNCRGYITIIRLPRYGFYITMELPFLGRLAQVVRAHA